MALPFNPQSFSSLILWLDASDQTSLVTNGSSVVQWRDKSMFRNHTAVSSTTAPVISSLNGLSTVYFNSRSGSAQFYQGPLSTILQSSFTGFTSSFSVFAVGVMVSSCIRSFNRFFVNFGSNTSTMDGMLSYQFQTESTIGITENSNTLFNLTQDFLLFPSRFSPLDSLHSQVPAYSRGFQTFFTIQTQVVILSTNPAAGAQSHLWSSAGTNGDIPYMVNNGRGSNLSANRYSIGGTLFGAPTAQTSWDGHICEVLIYNTPPLSPLTITQVQQVQGYLAKKWGLSSDLQLSHPYRTSPLQISTITGAPRPDVGSTSKLFYLPSSSSLPSQLIWMQGQGTFLSSATLVPNQADRINGQVDSVIQLNQLNQGATLINTAANTWTLHSRFEGALSNVGVAPYTYFSSLSTIGTTAGNFGYSVAVNSNSRYLAGGGTSFSTNSGLVFMFAKNTLSDRWVNTQRITPSDTIANQAFGTSLSMSADGTYLLVGSASNDIGGVTDVGAAYLFKKDATSDLWSQVQKLTVSDVQQSMLIGQHGRSAMSQDGSIIALGSPGYDITTPIYLTDAGAVYLFKKDPTTDSWSQVQRITLSDPTRGARFGASLSFSADGSYLVVGAPVYSYGSITNFGSAFLYKKSATSDLWNYLHGLQRFDRYEETSAESLGESVVMSGDGTTVLGAFYRGNFNSGRYFMGLYKRRTTTDYYDRVQYLRPYQVSQFTGYSLSLSDDGTFAAVAGTSGNTGGQPVTFFKKQTTTDLWTMYAPGTFSNSAGDYGTDLAMDSNCQSLYVGSARGGIFEYRQSTLQVIAPSSSMILVNTASQKGTILLPPASANPGQMLWIKDIGGRASNNPVSISTPLSTFLMSNYTGMFFYQNNFSAQFQSDGISNYSLVNYYPGVYTGETSTSTYFVPFFLQRQNFFNSTGTIKIPIELGNVNVETAYPSNKIILPINTLTSFDNIYFKSNDNQTILPHWVQPPTWNSGSNNTYVYVRIPTSRVNYNPFFLYWDSNSYVKQQPFSTFDLFDDFSSAPGGQPDPSRWRTEVRGSGTPSISMSPDGFLTLQGSDNQNASASIISRTPILSGTLGLAASASCFGIVMGYSCTDVTGTVVGYGRVSTIQDGAGGQANWSITTLQDGNCFYTSTLTRNFGFQLSTSRAVVIGASNIVTSFGVSTSWTTISYLGSNVYQGDESVRGTSLGPLLRNPIVNQNSNMYVHIAQTSRVGFPAPKLFINYIAAYNSFRDSTDQEGIVWGTLNNVLYSP
jgi:hypothetical protein